MSRDAWPGDELRTRVPIGADVEVTRGMYTGHRARVAERLTPPRDDHAITGLARYGLAWVSCPKGCNDRFCGWRHNATYSGSLGVADFCRYEFKRKRKLRKRRAS